MTEEVTRVGGQGTLTLVKDISLLNYFLFHPLVANVCVCTLSRTENYDYYDVTAHIDCH